jgi:hypothetical protein
MLVCLELSVTVAISGSTVVEPLPNDPKVVGYSPAIAAGTSKGKGNLLDTHILV